MATKRTYQKVKGAYIKRWKGFPGCGYFHYNGLKDPLPTLEIGEYQLSAETTNKLWISIRSFPSLAKLTISDSSLSFPSSPPELPSVVTLIAKRVTSQSYEGLLSSLPGLEEIDITIDDAERDVSQITAALRRTGGQQLTSIILQAPSSLPLEKKTLSTAGMNCTAVEDVVYLVESLTYMKSVNRLLIDFPGCGRVNYYKNSYSGSTLTLAKYQLSTEMTIRMWSCLRSFPSLVKLTISDSSLSFPPSPPELPSVTKLKAESVTSQSYEGLLSSLPGLEKIDITIGDAERDISQITAGLRRTGGQQLTDIIIQASSSLPSEKKNVSRETMRGLGLVIREQTKNLYCLYYVNSLKCMNEEDLVYLTDCCRHVKTMEYIEIYYCGTKGGGRLDSHLQGLDTSRGLLSVHVWHDDGRRGIYIISKLH